MIHRIMIDLSLERKLNKPDYDIGYISNLTMKIPEKYAPLIPQMRQIWDFQIRFQYMVASVICTHKGGLLYWSNVVIFQ